MRRFAIMLSALALVVAGCGGSDKTTATTGNASGAGVGSAAVVLAGIKAHQGPIASDVKVGITLDGSPAGAGAAAALLSGPISLELKGTGDAATTAADVDFSVSAGALNLAGKLRTNGKQSWIQYGNDWYVLDSSQLGGITGALGTGSAGATGDPAGTASKLSGTLTNPGAFLKDAKVVGDESVDGIDTTHVAGTVDIAKLVGAMGRALGSSAASPSAKNAADLQNAVRTATVDVWVGNDDAEVHRLKIALDLDMTKVASTTTQGLNGVKLDVSVTMKGADAPKIVAPENARPAQDLLQAIFGSLGPALGGGLGGTLTQ